MILYFSGTGNSEYVAKRIGQATKDEVLNMFGKIRDGIYSSISSDRSWVVVAPTYAWRIPRILQQWLEKTKFTGNKDIYFVMTCGDGIGDAEKYLKKLSAVKDMNYKGCYPIKMPENYIALFTTPTREQALEIISQAENEIDNSAEFIKESKAFPQISPTWRDKLSSGIVNDLFYPMFVHAKKFYVTNACVSCGKCAAVCPLKNILLENGRPKWGNACTHCMACICRCPTEAIEYGEHSKGLFRYTCRECGGIISIHDRECSECEKGFAEIIHISKAQGNDLEAILELQYLAYQSEAKLFNNKDIPPLRQTIQQVKTEYETGTILKAVNMNDKIVGSVRGYLKNDTVHIGKLIVHPDLQRRGIGTQLLLEMERIYPDKRYELFTSTRSLSNIKMYENLGYVIFKEEAVDNELKLIYLQKGDSNGI